MGHRLYWVCEKCGRSIQAFANAPHVTAALLCDACERSKANEDNWEWLKSVLSGHEPAVS